MSHNESFLKIANELGGKASSRDEKYFGGIKGNIVASIYELEFEYAGIYIHLINDFGQKALGEVECNFSTNEKNSSFKLRSIGPWKQLFSPRSTPPLSISSVNVQLKKHLTLSESFKELCQFTKEQRFEPEITGTDLMGEYKLQCRYHLLFDNQTDVILPICRFICEVIDFLKE